MIWCTQSKSKLLQSHRISFSNCKDQTNFLLLYYSKLEWKKFYCESIAISALVLLIIERSRVLVVIRIKWNRREGDMSSKYRLFVQLADLFSPKIKHWKPKDPCKLRHIRVQYLEWGGAAWILYLYSLLTEFNEICIFFCWNTQHTLNNKCILNSNFKRIVGLIFKYLTIFGYEKEKIQFEQIKTHFLLPF